MRDRCATPAVGVALALMVSTCGDEAAPALRLGAGLSTVRPLIWTERAKLLPDDGAANQHFGGAVSFAGDTAVIGACDHYDYDTIGSAYVFVRGLSSWSQQAKLVPSYSVVGDLYGQAVAFAGETAIVAGAMDVAGQRQGAAYVFLRDGVDWTEQAVLSPTDGAVGDGFGVSVAVDGNTAVVGAPNAMGGGYFFGAAYVFERVGSGWSEEQRLAPSAGESGAEFGRSVGVNGDTAVVGAPEHNHAAGAAYVFERTSGSWARRAVLAPEDLGPDDRFGSSIAIGADTIALGAQERTYLFVRDGDSWLQQARLDAIGGSEGTSTAAAGAMVVVGAELIAPTPQTNVGEAVAFVRDGQTWREIQHLEAGDGSSGDQFGHAVAISGDTVLVGAIFDDDRGVDSGSVYVFELKAIGDACAAGFECSTGFCVDNVCCATACGLGTSGGCQVCSVAAGSSSDGACAVFDGTLCDDGDDCTSPDVCAVGACVGGDNICPTSGRHPGDSSGCDCVTMDRPWHSSASGLWALLLVVVNVSARRRERVGRRSKPDERAPVIKRCG